MKINKNYNNLKENYLFSTINNKVEEYKKNNPDIEIIKLGIGDVTLPLCKAVITELHNSVEEMSTSEGFHGYGPYQGYEFLRKAIKNHYEKYNVCLNIDEIFVSDGAKSDMSNILDIFEKDNTVLIPDPVYPVYVDTNIMDGRKILYINANESNKFLPMPDKNIKVDIIYICSPNNPTGSVYSKKQLKEWVRYAIDNNAVILFDAAYENFITEDELPHSIYEIDDAKKCAIEFCSLSKTAGFTGTRCSYTIVPKEIEHKGNKLNSMWLRRQTTKYNGVPYIIQKGASAVFTDEGQKQIKEMMNYYKTNSLNITKLMDELNIWYTGGKNSPYIWFKCPNQMKSWDFFDLMLNKAHVVGTPGVGFGENGEGFFRLTAFGNRENTLKAINNIKTCFIK